MENVLAELTTLSDAGAVTSRDEEGHLKAFSLSRGGSFGVVPMKNLEAGVNALTAMGKVATYPGESAFRLYDTFGLPTRLHRGMLVETPIYLTRRSPWFRRRHGRAAQACTGFLEGRLESFGQPPLIRSLSTLYPVRGLSQDALHRMRSVGHHQAFTTVNGCGRCRS